MSFIYITGPAGSGKSALTKLLQTRGINAYDEDASGVGSAHNLQSGEPVTIPTVDERDADWFSRHEWRILETMKGQLKTLSATQPIILFGNSVKPDEQAELFDKVVYLKIDEKTLRERILGRTDNDYGKSEDEMQRILDQKQVLDDQYSGAGVIAIDATRPLDEVADAIQQVVKS
jgi:dephospho-CoA kinase